MPSDDPSVMQRDCVIKTNSCVIIHEEEGTESQNTAPKKKKKNLQFLPSSSALCLPSVIILLSGNNIKYINVKKEREKK